MYQQPSIDSLRKQVATKSFSYAVWPGEAIDPSAIERTEEEDLLSRPGKVDPLLIDVMTACRVIHVYDALSRDDLKAKVARMVCASRAQFSKIAELAWRA